MIHEPRSPNVSSSSALAGRATNANVETSKVSTVVAKSLVQE
jgi:hypothetical protein